MEHIWFIGGILGDVLETRIYDMPDITTMVKVRIVMNTKSSIMSGMYIGRKMNGVSWVDFGYERLHMLCFYYGFMGHNEEHCSNLTPSSHDLTEVNPLEPWMKGTNNGRK